jgi:hypothetical protein
MADNKDTKSDSSNSEMALDENKMVQLEDHAQLPKELTQDEISKLLLKILNDTFNEDGKRPLPRSVRDDFSV